MTSRLRRVRVLLDADKPNWSKLATITPTPHVDIRRAHSEEQDGVHVDTIRVFVAH